MALQSVPTPGAPDRDEPFTVCRVHAGDYVFNVGIGHREIDDPVTLRQVAREFIEAGLATTRLAQRRGDNPDDPPHTLRGAQIAVELSLRMADALLVAADDMAREER